MTRRKEPEEAVYDALVSVWERIVALIASWNAQLKIIIMHHTMIIIKKTKKR